MKSVNLDVETLYLNRQLMTEGEVWDGWEVCSSRHLPALVAAGYFKLRTRGEEAGNVRSWNLSSPCSAQLKNERVYKKPIHDTTINFSCCLLASASSSH